MTPPMILRPLADTDVPEYAEMLFSSFNAFYRKLGWKDNYFACQAQDTRVFYDIYNDLNPGCSIAAFAGDTGPMMGACFYHPREHHVSLGIMAVNPDYFGQGVGKALVNHILGYTKEAGYRSCRLVGSAINMDSLSLYNRAGFVPQATYHDMLVAVPEMGLVDCATGAAVRDATLADIDAMGDLEFEVSGIRRTVDYRYAIENPRGILHAAVIEDGQNGIDGLMISIRHPALNMLGPCVARTEEATIALIQKELDRFRGSSALLVVPMNKRKLVRQLYAWGAVNVETHLKQVWGEFRDFKGVNMPSFLPETG